MKFFQSISYCYNNLSISGKLLILICIFLFFVVFFKMINRQIKLKEGYSNNNNDNSPHITFKEGNDIYDDFYSDIYDHLVYNKSKNIYEIKNIIKTTNMNNESIILDIGCGTGHHIKELADANLNAVGVDISPSMINVAKTEYPSLEFKTGDALDSSLFPNSSLTHVLCLYFTIYYFKDKRYFFDNCMEWLMPGGYLIVHLVDREHFDPILPPGNPLYLVSPQKYAKDRITHTKVTFTDFVYKSNFKLDTNNNLATFDEKFKFNNGKIRKQQQQLHMDDTSVIVNIAQECGFILKGKIDLVKCAYENQFLYIFVKPS